MINYWLLPSLITFILLLLIARYEEVPSAKIEWRYLIAAAIVWPIGVIGVFTIAIDYFLYKERL